MNNPSPGVIIVLGAPNDETGRLSERALERAERALEEFHDHPGYRILTTGGYGAHFNTTSKPHGCYSRQYLIGKGVPENAFLPVAESTNTPEDARLSKPILEPLGVRELRIVTSDFHVARARFCFEREFPSHPLVFCPATTIATEAERQRLHDHETRALARLKGSDPS